MEREEHVWHAFAAVMSSLCAARTETQDDETSWESGLDSAHAVPDSRLQFHSVGDHELAQDRTDIESELFISVK